MKITQYKAFVTFFVAITFFITGCVSTNINSFSDLSVTNKASKTLAIAPIANTTNPQLQKGLPYHLNSRTLHNTYQDIDILSSFQTSDQLLQKAMGADLSPSLTTDINTYTTSDYLLLVRVNDVVVERFNGTQTRRLEPATIKSHYRYDRTAYKYNPHYSVRKALSPNDRVRATLAISATVYDLNTGKAIWTGKYRDDFREEGRDYSASRVVDSVVQKISKKLVSSLTA